MNILHVANLHQNYAWFDWVKHHAPKYDAVVIAGDLLNSLDQSPDTVAKQIEWTDNWLKDFPVRLFVCSGEHDYFPPRRGIEEHSNGAWLQRCARPNLWVDGQTARIGGLRWAVLPWLWTEWPCKTDVVIVHEPPCNSDVSEVAKKNKGSYEVYEGIRTHGPRWVLSGHVHESKSWAAKIHDTMAHNPLCYPLENEPCHITLDTKTTISIYNRVGKTGPI